MTAHQPIEPLDRPDTRTLEQKGKLAVEKIISRLSTLKVEYVPIDSIFPNPYNPNRQSEREFDLLKLSICEDGFTQPVIVQRSSKMIVDGEHRWRACNQLGLKEIPVVFVDMNDQQMRISTLRHNRARGSEDVELSIQVLADLRELGSLDKAIASLDISDLELQALLSDLPAPEQMANKTFSESWSPDKTADAIEPERMLANRRISTSQGAQDALMLLRTKKDESTTLMEERAISYESSAAIAQLTATFSNEDARLVRDTLGMKPAQHLVELCIRKVLESQELYEPPIYESALLLRNRLTK